ncbi:MAG TPA: hypothetical protein VIJ18_15335 [Microbacteriaceae bacterium]
MSTLIEVPLRFPELLPLLLLPPAPLHPTRPSAADVATPSTASDRKTFVLRPLLIVTTVVILSIN